ncbi:MAG TPA: ABC transporter substrate-binding protein [Kamptonema sp.]|nr:ABC transporter substrate-binding protein [Kamptonema sp.]
MLKKQTFLLLFLLSIVLVACLNTSKPATDSNPTGSPANSSASNTLNIWWNKGYYPEEDTAFQQIITEWEKKSPIKVKLSFITDANIIQKTDKALISNKLPDIFFAHLTDINWSPKWAWEGKLVDVSDVIEPIKNLYAPNAIESVYLYNNKVKKRSYYAVPIEQQTIHISYWRDLLKEIGTNDNEIPKDWDGFWNFWKQAQEKLRQQGQKNIYALGLPMSPGASDTYFMFEQFLEAYHVKLLDEKGQLLVDTPATRQGIIKVLDWCANFYKEGVVPPGALSWQNTDNNVNFLNKTTLITANPSLSIPTSQKQDTDLYYNKIGTMEFPNEPDGKPMRYMASVKQAVIFASSPHQKVAKEFLSYLVQPENLGTYIKNSAGRWFPVMPQLLKDAFWKDPKDPHLPVALKQFTERQIRPFYPVLNPAYVKVQQENVWGQTLNRILKDRLSPEQAADEAIAQIKKIFAEWK